MLLGGDIFNCAIIKDDCVCVCVIANGRIIRLPAGVLSSTALILTDPRENFFAVLGIAPRIDRERCETTSLIVSRSTDRPLIPAAELAIARRPAGRPVGTGSLSYEAVVIAFRVDARPRM